MRLRRKSTMKMAIREDTEKNLYFVTSKMALLNVLWVLCVGDPTIIHLKNGSQHRKSSFIPAVLYFSLRIYLLSEKAITDQNSHI